MQKKSYRDLFVWKKGIELSLKIYQITDTFPQTERFGLAAQMRSAATSIPSNIAEGQGRISNGEWLQFLGHARGSLYELQTQMVLAVHLGYVQKPTEEEVDATLAHLGAALGNFIKYVRGLKGTGGNPKQGGSRGIGNGVSPEPGTNRPKMKPQTTEQLNN